MKPKGLIISVVLLAVLGGLVWWSNKKQAAAAKTPTDTTAKILTIPEDQFQEIRIKKTGAEPIDLKRDNGEVADCRAQAICRRSRYLQFAGLRAQPP